MKRLLKICFDLALLSFIPILSWFCLSLVVDKNLINVFSLTYPVQFVGFILKSIFSTGANINKEKDDNKNAVMSGIISGSIIAIFIYGFIALNIDNYISFMNMDVSLYRNFALYSVVQMFIQVIFTFVLEKLYYEEKNDIANRYSLTFNLLNFIILIGSALIFENQLLIIGITLISIAIFTTYVMYKSFDKFKLDINVLKWIRYDSVELFNNIAFLIIFLFGLSNAFEYGEQYTLALNFVALITDTQWDVLDAVKTVATIDISKGKFNYKEHKRNAYKLLMLMLFTVLLMFIVLYNFYDLDFKLVLIYFNFELINFMIYPIYRTKMCYLQLEYSAFKTTTNKIASSGLRMFLSFLKTPFCTGIGQVSSSIYQFITFNFMFHKNYKISKDGRVVLKEKRV